MSDWITYVAGVAVYLYVIGFLIGLVELKDAGELDWRGVLLVMFWPIIAPLAILFGDR